MSMDWQKCHPESTRVGNDKNLIKDQGMMLTITSDKMQRTFSMYDLDDKNKNIINTNPHSENRSSYTC
jgi:hypothetical protein